MWKEFEQVMKEEDPYSLEREEDWSIYWRFFLAGCKAAATPRLIDTAPKDGSYILLLGPSGYITTPLRAEVGHYDPEYRPRNPWQTYSNDAFTDSGGPATHWLPLPEIEED